MQTSGDRLTKFYNEADLASRFSLQGYLDHLVVDSRPPARLTTLLKKDPWEDDLIKIISPLFELAAGFIKNTPKRNLYVTAPRGHCLAGESLIFDPILNDYRELQNIDGDFHVYARNEKGDKVISQAYKPFLKGTSDLYEITLSNGQKFRSTLGHRILSSFSWQQIRASFGIPLLSNQSSVDFSWVHITKIEYLRKDKYYDFTVPIHHNYELAGICNYNSKTSLLALMSNWALVYAKRAITIVCGAASKDQAKILLDRMSAEAKLNPWLEKNLIFSRYEVRGPKGTLKVLSSDAPPHSGLLTDLILLDELTMHYNRALYDILLSGKNKRPTGCFAIISNAGLKNSWQEEQLDIAKRSDQWIVHEVPPFSASWINEKDIDEQRMSLPPAVFKRLHLNEWTVSNEGNPFVTVEQLKHCLNGQPSTSNREESHVIALDFGAIQDRTALCVCHAEDGIVILDQMEVWQGNRTNPIQIQRIEDWVRQQLKNFRVVKIILDPYQLEGTAQLFQKYVEIERYSFKGTGYQKLSENLRSILLNRRIKLYPGAGPLEMPRRIESLEDELLELEIIETPGEGWRWQHSRMGHDDRCSVLAMCALALAKARVLVPEIILCDVKEEEQMSWRNRVW